jgi:hypothetical protein
LKAQALPEGGGRLDKDIFATERGDDDIFLMWPRECFSACPPYRSKLIT